MEPFFSRLSYSFGNEDWRTEQEALKIKPEDRIVCITGSGDRPLHLLLSGGKEVVSVDANPFQSQLLQLKASAIGALDHDQYLRFLGAKKEKDRLSLYQQLLPRLSPETTQFWNKHIKMIEKGVIYQGRVEKLCQLLAFLVGWMRKKKMKKLFSFDDIEKQRQFIREEWDNGVWKGAFAIALHPWMTRLFVKDPGLYSYLGEKVHPATYVREKINEGLGRHLAKEALMANLVFKGKVPENALPPYLQPKGSEKIRENLSRLKIQTQNVLSYLEEAPDASFDVFSLSDVASYLSQEDFIRLSKAILRTARPGARFCLRQFMSDYQIPKELSSHFVRETQLEKKLDMEDNCFVYRFTVGKIVKE
ncbi:MAG: DUF3419 family protein [Candidatus Melainabacteria bacterium]|nr:DUF3419 family protein [Candidatus Melainabacteria bacterium]